APGAPFGFAPPGCGLLGRCLGVALTGTAHGGLARDARRDHAPHHVVPHPDELARRDLVAAARLCSMWADLRGHLHRHPLREPVAFCRAHAQRAPRKQMLELLGVGHVKIDTAPMPIRRSSSCVRHSENLTSRVPWTVGVLIRNPITPGWPHGTTVSPLSLRIRLLTRSRPCVTSTVMSGT